MDNAVARIAPRSRFGVWSLMLAAVAFVIAVTSLAVFAAAPKEASDIQAYVFMIGFLGVAPLLHLLGFAFGIAAMAREGHRKGLGLLGVILNAAAISIGIGLVWFMLYVSAAFT